MLPNSTNKANQWLSSMVLKDALSEFGIEVLKLSPVTGGLQSKAWRADAFEDRYFVKEQAVASAGKVHFAVGVVESLSRAGIPVPQPVRTRGGAAAVERLGIAVTVSEWAAGSAWEQGVGASPKVLGEWLARIHIALRAVKPQSMLRTRASPDHSATLARLRQIFSKIGNSIPCEEGAARLVKDLLKRMIHLEGTMKTRPAEFSVFSEYELIHGDYQRGNILCDERGDVAGFVDFDAIHLAPRVWDVARAITYLFQCRLEESQRFVEAYDRLHPLPPNHLAMLAIIAEDYALCSIWEYEEYLHRGKEVGSALRWEESIQNLSRY